MSYEGSPSTEFGAPSMEIQSPPSPPLNQESMSPTPTEENPLPTIDGEKPTEENPLPTDGEKPTEEDRVTDIVRRKIVLRNALSEAERDAGKTTEKINSLRQQMGLPSDVGTETSSQNIVADLKQKLDAINQQEQEALGVPDDKPSTPQEEERATTPPEEIEGQLNNIEEETREEREKFIQGYIDAYVQKFIEKGGEDGFKDELESSENRQKAEQLIRIKTTAEIFNRAKDFIETGDADTLKNLQFKAHLTLSNFDTPNEEKKFVTSYRLEFNDGETVQIEGNKQFETTGVKREDGYEEKTV